MSYLVDANVLSEATRSDPDPRVIEWLRRHESDLLVDPIILGEMRFGINLLRPGKRRARLDRWFEERVFRMHCLPWEAATGMRWAELLAHLRLSGQSMPIKDSLIAATALFHRLTIATRNTSDFEKAGVAVVDPFA